MFISPAISAVVTCGAPRRLNRARLVSRMRSRVRRGLFLSAMKARRRSARGLERGPDPGNDADEQRDHGRPERDTPTAVARAQNFRVRRVYGFARVGALVGSRHARSAEEVKSPVVRILGEIPAKMHLVADAHGFQRAR